MTLQQFQDRYDIDIQNGRLGGGGFGTVYKAYDTYADLWKAVKISEVKWISNKEFSLVSEFAAIEKLPIHKNIANYEAVYQFTMPNGKFDYAIMQYYPFGNLKELLKKEPLSPVAKKNIADGLIDGIIFLHNHQVVHRDIKPSNILISERKGVYAAKIADFGLSKKLTDEDYSHFTNSFGGGTLEYSSPEQLLGQTLKYNTDLWSLGVILYEIFIGKIPFVNDEHTGSTAAKRRKIYQNIVNAPLPEDITKVPSPYDLLIQECLIKDPKQRLQNANQMLSILDRNTASKQQRNKYDPNQILGELVATKFGQDDTVLVEDAAELDRLVQQEIHQKKAKEIEQLKRKQEAEKLKIEQERLEKERLEKLRIEQAKLDQERKEKERKEQERKEKEAEEKRWLEEERKREQAAKLKRQADEKKRIEKERKKKEKEAKKKSEQERKEKERLEKLRLRQEQEQKEIARQKQIEHDKKEKELARIKREEEEKAAQIAKEKARKKRQELETREAKIKADRKAAELKRQQQKSQELNTQQELKTQSVLSNTIVTNEADQPKRGYKKYLLLLLLLPIGCSTLFFGKEHMPIPIQDGVNSISSVLGIADPENEASTSATGSEVPEPQPSNIPSSQVTIEDKPSKAISEDIPKIPADQIAWDKLDKNSIDALESFVRKFPNSEYAKEVDILIQAIVDRNRATSEQELWKSIKRQDDKTAYVSYLQQYPNGIYKEEALEALDRIKSYALDNERKVFEELKSLNSIWDIDKYLQTYPNGLFRKEALEHRELLKQKAENEAWKLINEDPTITSLQNFLKQYPDSEHKSEAVSKIKELQNKKEEIVEAPVPRPMDESKLNVPKLEVEDAEVIKVETKTLTFEMPAVIDFVEKNMVDISGGEFTFGVNNPGKGQLSAARKTVSSFKILDSEVSQSLYKRVMKKNPSDNDGCTRCAVENVTFADAVAFTRKLNELTGNRYNYRIPNEIEWEYAATKAQNSGIVLDDMIGNVAEWCQNSQGGSKQVVKGGSWKERQSKLNIKNRVEVDANKTTDLIGFRIIRDIK